MQVIGLLLWLSCTLIVHANFVTWKDIDNGHHGSYPTQAYISSKAKAPYMNFVQKSPACKDGLYYFITPRGWKNKDPGPMILDDDGSLIWSQHFANEYGGRAYNLQVQQYRGEDYLTFWLGDDRVRGHGAGHYYMLNSSYDVVHKVGAANSEVADLHDFVITSDNTALIMKFEQIQSDLRPTGHQFSDLGIQAAWDCLFQEIDIESGQLIFEWRAAEHLNMSLSYNKIETADIGTLEKPFEWIHLNSVEKDELGNYLVSARNLHAMIYVDGKTKDVIWILGGKANDFQDLSDGYVLNMAWQHDAKFIPSSAFPETYKPSDDKGDVSKKLITVFDNAALDWDYQYGSPHSRALLLEVTYPTARRTTISKSEENLLNIRAFTPLSPSEKDSEKVNEINGTDSSYTVRIVQEYVNPQRFLSSTQGSVQLIFDAKRDTSHIFVGYGINAVMTDFYSNGSVACDIHFGAKTSWESGDIQSYRAYKFPWTGLPKEPPTVTAYRGKAYVSWNGATEVRQWLLQSSLGDSTRGWHDIALVTKTGFETVIPLKTSKYDASNQPIRVLAVDNTVRVCKNGVSAPASAYRFAAGITAPLSNISHLNLAVVVLGSAMALSLVYRRRMFRRGNSTRSHRLD